MSKKAIKSLVHKSPQISSQHYLRMIGVVMVITFALYFPSLNNSFTNWDDDKYILESTTIRTLSPVVHFTSFSVGLYTPVTTWSYALDFSFYGFNAWGFHLSSLVFHLIATLLVIVFIHRLSTNKLIALVVGALFALHPTHVESVCWASGRKDLLYAIFSLCSLICYLEFGKKNHGRYLGFSGLFFLLACLSKPTAIALPATFFALDYIREGKVKWSFLYNKVPFLIVSLLIFGIGLYGIKQLAIKVTPETGYNVWQIVCMASYGIVFYFYKALLPLRLSNFHVYPYPFKDIPGEYQFSPLFLALIAFLFVRYRNRIPGWSTGLLLFFTLLLPTFRFYPTGYPIVAERYFYLSSIGLFFIAASIVHRYFYEKNGFPNVFTLSFFGLVMVIFSGATYARTRIWKDSLTVWSDAIKTYPQLYYAYESRGKYYLSKKNTQAAISDFSRSLQIEPKNPELMNTYGNLLFENGKIPLALTMLNQSIQMNPKVSKYYYNRGNIYKSMGEMKKAISDYNQSIQLDSSLAQAFNNRGVSKIFTGDTLGAFLDFRKAYQMQPSDTMFKDNLERTTKLLRN